MDTLQYFEYVAIYDAVGHFFYQVKSVDQLNGYSMVINCIINY